jgi:Transposase IS116/IS110/IS902 family
MGKQVVALIGLKTLEKPWGNKAKLGRNSKAGKPIFRFLLEQAAQTSSRFDQKLKAKCFQLAKKQSVLQNNHCP